jgi:hypothetical protein
VDKTLAVACAALLALLEACSSSPKQESKYPPQKEGCEVQVFPDAPSMSTESIGSVGATCDESVSDDDCVRQLKDETCKLGGNVVWGVDPKPKLELGKKKLSGRAAHTK